MLLRRIEVENFRGLRSAVVELDETTALIGENSAGKTTLLDAVAICCGGRDDRVTLEVRDFRQAGQSPPSESLGIALTFEGTDAEWAEQVRAPFLRFLRPGPPGRRVIRLEVSGRRHPERNAVEASWTFAGGEGRSSGPQPGLLAEWRRLTPMLRLRANRYVEQDPRGTAAAAGRADVADATDPVASSSSSRSASSTTGSRARRTSRTTNCGAASMRPRPTSPLAVPSAARHSGQRLLR